jgi:hypothetical protein
MNLKQNLRFVAIRKARRFRKAGKGSSKRIETRENLEISNFRTIKETKNKLHLGESQNIPRY